MSYEFRSSVKNNKISMPVKILAFITIVLVILYFILPNLLPTVFITIVRPFWNIENNIRYGRISVSVETQNSYLIELQKENIELKNLLGRQATTSESQGILAKILKKPPFSAYDIFIIDIGSGNDIKIGDKVYAVGNVLIGEIVEIVGNTSKVRLHSSYGEKYDVFIGDSNIQATAIGRGGGSFEASLPRDVKIYEGDIVTVPSLTDNVFARVKQVISDPAKSFSTIIFAQPLNIYEQKWVLVHKK